MWYKIIGTNIELRVFAKPSAKRSEIIGVNENGLCVALKARPQEGEANRELIAFLAKIFHLTKRDITLKRGLAARHKAVVLPMNGHVEALIAAFSSPS